MKKGLFLIIIITIIAVLTKFYISNYKIEYKVNGYDVKTIYKDKRFYFEIKDFISRLIKIKHIILIYILKENYLKLKLIR